MTKTKTTARACATMADLREALDEFTSEIGDYHESEIYLTPSMSLRLVEQTLSDGSNVYDIHFG